MYSVVYTGRGAAPGPRRSRRRRSGGLEACRRTAVFVLTIFVLAVPGSQFRERKTQNRVQDLWGPPTLYQDLSRLSIEASGIFSRKTAGVPWQGSVSACLAWGDLFVDSMFKQVPKRLGPRWSWRRHRFFFSPPPPASLINYFCRTVVPRVRQRSQPGLGEGRRGPPGSHAGRKARGEERKLKGVPGNRL